MGISISCGLKINENTEHSRKYLEHEVKSFQDALTRQVSEAVRISMRGEGILNSKTEYSRCRIPRLTIDTEGWKKFKKEESEREKQLELQQMQSQEEELRLTERRMDECEQSSRRMESKRKQEATKRKAKKLRLEPLVEW